MHDKIPYPILRAFASEERIMYELLKPKAGDIVIDCGAYVGRLTIMAAKSIGNRERVIAIEPDPYSFNLLLLNLSLNRVIDQVIPLNIALSDKTGFTKLYRAGWPALHSIIW